MAKSPQVKITFLSDSKQAQKDFQDTGKQTEALEGHLSGLDDAFGKASAGAHALGAAMAGAGIGIALKVLDGAAAIFGKLKGSVIDTNATLEQSKQGWTIMLGGAEAAEAKIQDLYKFAADTPFEFGEVDKAARLLETFGGAALDTKDNLKLVGDIAAATDQPFSDVAMWVGRMYSAMQNGQPFGEAAARLQEMGALSGEARTELERMQKEGASGAELWAKFNGVMGRFSGTMQAQAGTWNGLMSTVQDTLNQLAATAGKPIFDFASKGLHQFADALSSPKVAAFAQLIADKLAGALSLVSRIVVAAWPPVQRFVQGILSGGRAVLDAAQAFLTGKTNLGQFIGGIEILVGKTLGNLGHLKDLVGPVLGAFGGKILDFVRGMVPQIVGQLQVWGQRFGDWVSTTAWPWLSQKLTDLGTGLVGWVRETAIPQAVAALVGLGTAFGDWVTGTAIPTLQKAIPQWVAFVQDWVTNTAVPAAREKLIEVGTAFADWVTGTAIPFVQTNLPLWWQAIEDWLTQTGIPAATKALGGIAQAFYGWLLGDALPYQLRNLPKWWVEIEAWIYGTAVPAAAKALYSLALAFGDWVTKDAVPYLKTNLPVWLKELGDWLRLTAGPAVLAGAQTLGTAMVDGIIAGLRAAWGKIKAELMLLAQGLPAPVQAALGISSPSKVFAKLVGVPIVQGVAEGISSQRPMLHAILRDTVDVPQVVGTPEQRRRHDEELAARQRALHAPAPKGLPTSNHSTPTIAGGTRGASTAPAGFSGPMTVNFNFPNLTSLGDRQQVRSAFEEMATTWDGIVRGGRVKRDVG